MNNKMLYLIFVRLETFTLTLLRNNLAHLVVGVANHSM